PEPGAESPGRLHAGTSSQELKPPFGNVWGRQRRGRGAGTDRDRSRDRDHAPTHDGRSSPRGRTGNSVRVRAGSPRRGRMVVAEHDLSGRGPTRGGGGVTVGGVDSTRRRTACGGRLSSAADPLNLTLMILTPRPPRGE